MLRARPTVAVLAATAALLAGCSSVVDGTGSTSGSLGVSGPPSGSGGPTGSPGVPGSSGSSGPTGSGPSTPPPSTPVTTPPPSTAPAMNGAVLIPLLLPAPRGSRPWGDAWAAHVTPTLEQFVANAYPATARTVATAELVRDQLTGIAHRTWIASTGTQADVILFQFATVSGAQHRFSFAAESKNEGDGVRHFNIKASPLPIQTYYETSVDSDGYIRAITYTRVDRLVFEIFSYSKKRLRTNEILGWAKAQHALLT